MNGCTVRAEDEAVTAERRQFDIGIVVPLAEEFRYIQEVAPQIESVAHAGAYFYCVHFGGVSAVCCVAGQMGTLPALQTAIRLLEFADLRMLVVLGVAGALDDDIALGDVVIGTEINEFQANSKAEPIEGGYEVRYSGRHWALDFKIREALNNFEFAGKRHFADWQATTTTHHEQLGQTEQLEVTCPASVHFGPIASGNVVAASSAFVAEVKKVNRKFVAIDMEAAGVAAAAEGRVHPLPCLIIRGISDRADEKKQVRDGQGRGSWRRFAVRNATAFLTRLSKWEGFLQAAGLKEPKTQSTGELASALARALKGHVGGPWLAGVVFDVYQHGPAIRDIGIIPVDLSRLRITDARMRKLLDSADEAKQTLLGDQDVANAAARLARGLEEYRKEADAATLNPVLQGFDDVVLAILCPDEQHQQTESLLLQADKLEEEQGPDAAAAFLKEFIGVHPRVRERHIDALATSRRWPEVVDVLDRVEISQLSRLELEHGFSGCAEIGLTERAAAFLTQHHNAHGDNAAKMFRLHMASRYPDIKYVQPGDNKYE
jgi:nucleoside phosphorylase